MSKDVYIVSFFNTTFQSLEEAKWNVEIGLSRREAINFLLNADEEIFHFIGDILVSKTPIFVDEDGNISFGKTRKVKKFIRAI